jgi:hypothetical protein
VQFSQCKDTDAPGVEQVQVNLSDHSSLNLKSNTPLGTDDVWSPTITDVQLGRDLSHNCNSLTGSPDDVNFDEFLGVNEEVYESNVGRRPLLYADFNAGQRPVSIYEDILKINEVRSLGSSHLYSENRGRLCSSEGSQFNPIQVYYLESRDIETRSISKAEIFRLVNCNENLEEGQKSNLFDLLIEYASYLNSRPGKCKIFEYAFNLTDEKPIMSHTRPVPFSLRPAVREQIDQMLSNDILERSTSPFINVLTVVPIRDGPPRICIEARKVNIVTIPDGERTPPLHEFLQKFNGVKYMSSIDLSSAFLQIPLRDSSRQ